ncbi:sensor histidine kinase, partial [Thermodesulfobacteriota bacterium]
MQASIFYLDEESSGESQQYEKHIIYPHHDCDGNRLSVIEIPLLERNERLFLAVLNNDFGEELYPESPWYEFIERISQVAATSLIEIDSDERIKQLQFESLKVEGFAAASMTAGTILHQVKNLAKDLSIGTFNLDEAIKYGKITASERQKNAILGMRRSAVALEEMISDTGQLTAKESKRPCDLEEAIHFAERVFAYSISTKQILIERQPYSGTIIDIPLLIASSAISNILKNAIEAIDQNGWIKMNVRDEQEVIFCDIEDNGCGISKENQKEIFKLGFSTKKEKLGIQGWGLYTVQRSLIDYRGDLLLIKSSPGQTIFRIVLPKPRKD